MEGGTAESNSVPSAMWQAQLKSEIQATVSALSDQNRPATVQISTNFFLTGTGGSYFLLDSLPSKLPRKAAFMASTQLICPGFHSPAQMGFSPFREDGRKAKEMEKRYNDLDLKSFSFVVFSFEES